MRFQQCLQSARMLLCSRCACRMLGRLSPTGRSLSKDTSQEVPTSFNDDLEENKTSVTILNEDKSMVFFERFGRYGFKLSTGIFVLGPVLAFPKSVFSWRVSGTGDIGPASLSVLQVLYPRPDIFLLGKGDPTANLDSSALNTWFSMRDMYKEDLQALEVDKRRRANYQLLESTGGHYRSELLDSPPQQPSERTFRDAAASSLDSLKRPSSAAFTEYQRRQRVAEEAGENYQTARAAQRAKAHAQLQTDRQRQVEEAKRRVEDEQEGLDGADGDGEARDDGRPGGQKK
uniref:Transmembrane protein n=1 Tax=Macrostomum lignano TaxID=282301 RepID=A0A1I8HS75_9PLAT